MIIVTAHPPVEDTLNPDPAYVWVVAWARADDNNAPALRESLTTMTPLPEVFVMFPSTTWIARNVVVEEAVQGQPNLFRIRFKDGQKIK